MTSRLPPSSPRALLRWHYDQHAKQIRERALRDREALKQRQREEFRALLAETRALLTALDTAYRAERAELLDTRARAADTMRTRHRDEEAARIRLKRDARDAAQARFAAGLLPPSEATPTPSEETPSCN
jgi:hypothetical protein